MRRRNAVPPISVLCLLLFALMLTSCTGATGIANSSSGGGGGTTVQHQQVQRQSP